MQMDSKVAMVTGGAGGLGEGIAKVLAQRGADVAVADIDLHGAEEVARQLAQYGHKARAYRADVTSRDRLQETVETILAEFGRIDVLVNVAGVIAATGFEDTVTSREEDWDVTFTVNVKGTVLASEVVAEHMMKRGAGKIVNIASHAGRGGRSRRRRLRCVEGRSYSSHPVVCIGTRSPQYQRKCRLSGHDLDTDVGTNCGTRPTQRPQESEPYGPPNIRSGYSGAVSS